MGVVVGVGVDAGVGMGLGVGVGVNVHSRVKTPNHSKKGSTGNWNVESERNNYLASCLSIIRGSIYQQFTELDFTIHLCRNIQGGAISRMCN